MSNPELKQELYLVELEAAAAKVAALNIALDAMAVRASALENNFNTKTVWLKTTSTLNPQGGQTLEGNYFFGDASPVVSPQIARGADIVIGPTSSLEVRSLPRLSYHAVNKGYVDNIVSPLYTQLTQALSGKATAFVSLHKTSGTELSLDASTNLVSSSTDYTNFFTVIPPTLAAPFMSSIKCKTNGIYLFSFHLNLNSSAASFPVSFKIDTQEVEKMVFSSSGSDTITVCLKIGAGSAISWTGPSASAFTVVSETASLIKLGE